MNYRACIPVKNPDKWRTTVQAAEIRESNNRGMACAAERNTVCVSRALDVAGRGGDVVPDELLAHLTPLGWRYSDLAGDYLWGADASIGSDGFRPLRGIFAHQLTG